MRLTGCTTPAEGANRPVNEGSGQTEVGGTLKIYESMGSLPADFRPTRSDVRDQRRDKRSRHSIFFARQNERFLNSIFYDQF
jgi:hypothetical protein